MLRRHVERGVHMQLCSELPARYLGYGCAETFTSPRYANLAEKQSDRPATLDLGDSGCPWLKVVRSLIGAVRSASPDNAACEGFVGRLKTEMFCLGDRRSTTIAEFVEVLNAYVRWYNEKRIKGSLGYLSPIEYRESLGLTT